MKNINEITYYIIEEMKHCIGFDKNRITGTKHRIMYAYRNHFCDHKDNKMWNELVELQLAYVGNTNEESGICYYQLTNKGLSFLANLCGFEKIIEID
jgi:hypothetical protein